MQCYSKVRDAQTEGNWLSIHNQKKKRTLQINKTTEQTWQMPERCRKEQKENEVERVIRR